MSMTCLEMALRWETLSPSVSLCNLFPSTGLHNMWTTSIEPRLNSEFVHTTGGSDNIVTFQRSKRVAWSRLGCVAALSLESLSVNIGHLLFSGAGEKWLLHKEQAIDLSANGENQHPVLQLEWSQSGSDLALADSAGRVTVVNVSAMALNETTVVRPAILDREDELGQVLAMCWLNIDRPVGDSDVLFRAWIFHG
jgi:hypothetical protein